MCGLGLKLHIERVVMLLQKLSSVSPPFLQRKHRTTFSSPSSIDHTIKFNTSSRNPPPLRAVESSKDSEFELDRDKARKALEQLDQQLKSLSQKEVSQLPKKKKVPPPKLVSKDGTRDMMTMKEGMPEFEDSFFSYSAVALLAFTMFYNILFITVIQPAIDGP